MSNDANKGNREAVRNFGTWRSVVLRLPAQAALIVSVLLLLTFAAAALFGTYAVQYSRITAEQVRAEVLLSGEYEDARRVFALEQSLQRQYRLEGLPTIKEKFFSTRQSFNGSLDAIWRAGDGEARSLVTTIRSDHALYLGSADQIFAAVEVGQFAAADQIEIGLDPLAQNLELLLNNATNQQAAAASLALVTMNDRERSLGWSLPFVFGLGIVLVGLLLLLLEASRQARNAKSIFLAKMSHELRTPLNGILGFSQLMERNSDSLDERHRRYVGNIRTSGEHLLSVINDILDLSKVEAGKMELSRDIFMIGDVAEEAIKDIEPMAQARGHRIELSVVEDYELQSDRRRLVQVLLNGLANAVKFTEPSGRIQLVVGRTARSAELAIHDSGRGIPHEKLRRIFDEYAQVASRRAEEDEGTGLGLPISRRLTEMMGGKLTVESTDGQGTVFRVQLPLQQPSRSRISLRKRLTFKLSRVADIGVYK
jgi:signal transduction histidine kinase